MASDGFDELLNKLQDLGQVGNKLGKEALNAGAKVVLEQQKKDAPRSDNNDHGADYLEITKNTKSLTQVGFTKDNWKFTKGLWFSNWGFVHYKSKKPVTPHVGWMFSSFGKCQKEAKDEIVKVLGKEIDKIL